MSIVTKRQKLSEHFHTDEFSCRCGCGEIRVDTLMISLLEKIRAEFNSPVHVNSGYRCPEYNRKIGGATYSRHMQGDAADITISGASPNEVHAVANRLNPYGGVGKYATFTHVDTRGHKARWG